MGTAIPATHFLLLVREIMLKGAGLFDITGDMLAICIITVVIVRIALMRYSQTLD